MHSIFVQIASYRDPQLIPTVEDLLNNAQNPDNIKIGIAWQHSNEDEWDNLDKFKKDKRFNIIDIPYQESLGVCWARSKVQKLYNNEDYTLQIDSHHRFVKDWDRILVDMIKNLQDSKYPKPLITTYLPSFDPSNDPAQRINSIWKMNFDKFIPEGAIFFRPGYINQTKDDISKPLRARFFSGHFAFTLGGFCKEVLYDPNYYFHGEEINMAVRSFTHGYDLFHPNQIVAWHEYTRKDRTKQWDDDKLWHKKNQSSHERNRKLFGMDSSDIDFGEYGFGKLRSLQDYEKYAGISFKYRTVTEHVKKMFNPPDPHSHLSYLDFEKTLLSEYNCNINIPTNLTIAYEDVDFWAVIIKDEAGSEVYREDATNEEISRIVKNRVLTRNFHSYNEPKSWLIWPYHKTQGWINPVSGSW